MLFNNRKPEEPATDTVVVKPRQPAATAPASPPSPALQMSGGKPPRCVIDAGLVITGNLESERDVQLDGQLHGDIRCCQLIISRDAMIDGNIVAAEVVVRGKVKGIIHADQVMLQDTARVESEIFHKSLIIEEGACFDGETHRTDRSAGADAELEPRIADLQRMAADMKSAEASRDSEAAAA
jgi:cytoskeletal protein CcmA (bactofilin family)